MAHTIDADGIVQNVSVGANLIKKVGCYNDRGERALPNMAPGIVPNASESNLKKCAEWASGQGYTHFGLQYGGECWADTKEKTAVAETSYAKYGSKTCTPREGFLVDTGGPWENVVYTFVPKTCPKCSDKQTCSDKTDYKCVDKTCPVCAKNETCSVQTNFNCEKKPQKIPCTVL
jgi:hypothetical protein|uniref:WSC domain-containing protein n=1 Tax=viral metagenome TaxID=1070528 RepID=A0A6C0IWI8_9ZZZZ